VKSINIVSLCAGDTAAIVAACRFLSSPPDVTIELYTLEMEASFPHNDKVNIIALDSLSEIHQRVCFTNEHRSTLKSDNISFFSSITSSRQWAEHTQQTFPTLYVHEDLAVLEVHQQFDLASNFASYSFTPCVLSDDEVLKHLTPEISLLQFKDFRSFLSAKQADYLLLTANHNLVNALTAHDATSWEVFHPTLNVRNLNLDCAPQPESAVLQGITHAIRQLKHSISFPVSSLDLSGIRSSRRADEHAYSFFAKQYDDYMAHVDYETWISRILSWFKIYSPLKLTRILELACGTANVSNRLVHKGYLVDASDLSAEMLLVAESKPMKPNLYQASLTDPIPDKGYDLALCMFDSVNYLTKAAEFSQMLTHVHNALADKGLYIFDVSTLLNSEENFEDICNMTRIKDGYLVHQAWFETIYLRQKSSLNYFRKEYIGYSHHFEQHQQHVYMCHEIIDMVINSPFKLVAIHSTESSMNFYPRHLNGIDDKYFRLFFVLQKSPA
jgi:SAM-dependent methyltransferase